MSTQREIIKFQDIKPVQKLENKQIAFDGTEGRMVGCQIINCGFTLEGKAASTVDWMQAMYHNGCKDLIENIIDQIKSGEKFKINNNSKNIN